MKAVRLQSIHTDDPVVAIQPPRLRKNEVLVRVHSVGVNHIDLNWFDHLVIKPLETVFGLEVAGTVVDANGHAIQSNQRVAALVDSGGYAEFVAVPFERLILIPDEMSFPTAAAVPESYLTAYQGLFWLGNLKPNQTVLIHAGASGVGSADTQLAKLIPGVKVLTTSSHQKTAVCLANGANLAIDYQSESFVEQVERFTEGRGVDLVIDFIGAGYFADNLKALGVGGKLILTGSLGGNVVDQFDLRQVMMKKISIIGTLLSTRSAEYKARLTDAFSLFIKTHSFQPAPRISRQFSLNEAKQAQDYVRSKQNLGKVIINIVDS